MSAAVIESLAAEDYVNLEKCIDQLKNIELCESPEEVHKDILNEKFIKDVIEYIKTSNSEQKSLYYIFQLLAEIAKTDTGRQLCTNDEVIQIILNTLLKRPTSQKVDIPFQACRVFGNICFESEQARDIVLKLNGQEIMISLLKSLSDDVQSMKVINNNNNDDTSERDEILLKYIKVACGALINLIDEHEILQKHVLKAGVLEIIQKFITALYSNENIIKVILNLLEYFADTNSDETKEFLSSPVTWDGLYLVLKSTTDQEIVDMLFQILSTFAEKDDRKELMAKSDFTMKILTLVDDCETVSDVKIVDLACDFVILLLTGDKSMNILFDHANGPVYKKLRSWMSPECSVKIQSAAAFAICNFARSDANCVSLVNSGIIKEIKILLNDHPASDKQHVLQHALFGTLTNLAITVANRKVMLEEGVVDVCLAFLSTESYTVSFKMFGTIRMLLDQNEKLASELGMNEGFLKILKQSADFNSHEGIKWESLRIFASLVKNSRRSEVMTIMLTFDLVQRLLDLLESDHVIMKNEALISLNIMATVLGEKAFEKFSKEICLHLMYTLSLSSPSEASSSSPPPSSLSPKLPVEVLCNAITLSKIFSKFPTLESEFRENKFREKLLEMYKTHSDAKIIKCLELFRES